MSILEMVVVASIGAACICDPCKLLAGWVSDISGIDDTFAKMSISILFFLLMFLVVLVVGLVATGWCPDPVMGTRLSAGGPYQELVCNRAIVTCTCSKKK